VRGLNNTFLLSILVLWRNTEREWEHEAHEDCNEDKSEPMSDEAGRAGWKIITAVTGGLARFRRSAEAQQCFRSK
jgi:hypothetical protein